MPAAAPRRKARPAAPPADDPATAYARGVLAGEIPAGRLVKLACERHLRDLSRAGTKAFPWIFRPSIGQAFEGFCGLLKHYKGRWNGEPFSLAPFQVFFSYSILAWIDPATNHRRFRTAVIRVPRKNGKTTWAAALGLWLEAMDDEAGAEIYSVATKRDQAKIVFSDACRMLRKATGKVRERFVERVACLEYPRADAKFEPLSADSEKLDGLNPHAAICDETHAWPSRDLWDVLEDGMGAREQPLMLDISTAGTDTQSFSFQNHKRCEDILEGTITDEQFFAYVAMADAEDVEDWENPAVWEKANPGMGSIKSFSYLAQQAASARATPTKLNTFLIKQLNLWVNADERWLNPLDWKRGDYEGLREALAGRKCHGGLDLATVGDLSAFVLIFPASEVFAAVGIDSPALLSWHWCPADDIQSRSREDRVPYDVWAKQGSISPTPGNVTDYAAVRRDIVKICEEFQVADIAYDPWGASETVQYLQAEGVEMVQFRQGFASMSAPTGEFERLVKAGQILHEPDPLLAWEAGNVVVEKDAADNMKPTKKKSREKIDGIVAAIMALGRQMAGGEEPITPQVWSC